MEQKADHRFEKVHILICLLATTIIHIFCIVFEVSLIDTAIRLIFTIIAFYLIGLLAKYYITARIFPKPVPKDTPQEDTEDLSIMDNGPEEDFSDLSDYSVLEEHED